MMNSKIYFKTIILLIILLFIFIFKNNLFYLFSIINLSSKETNDNLLTENNILKSKCQYLEDELNNLTNIKYANYDYSLTRMSYRLSYLSNEISIVNSENIQVNDLVMNQFGLVGIVKTIKDKYSYVTLLTGINNLSVNINDTYGTLSGYENGYFIIKNITNYENVSINDDVYTSTLGNIKERIYIGKVIDIKITDIEKIIYVKSDVDFNNINYLYVVG